MPEATVIFPAFNLPVFACMSTSTGMEPATSITAKRIMVMAPISFTLIFIELLLRKYAEYFLLYSLTAHLGDSLCITLYVSYIIKCKQLTINARFTSATTAMWVL